MNPANVRGTRRAVTLPIVEPPLPPPRVLALRRCVGQLYDHLRFFGLVSGPPPRASVTIAFRTAPSDVFSFSAAELVVGWVNAGGHSSSCGLLSIRRSPVLFSAISAALLVACRACVLALSDDGLMKTEAETGAPLGLVMSGLEPVSRSDGIALAAATLAIRAICGRVPCWTPDSAAADEDAEAMARALVAAQAPLPTTGALPASAMALDRGVHDSGSSSDILTGHPQECLAAAGTDGVSPKGGSAGPAGYARKRRRAFQREERRAGGTSNGAAAGRDIPTAEARDGSATPAAAGSVTPRVLGRPLDEPQEDGEGPRP